jgi:hypothetical protein
MYKREFNEIIVGKLFSYNGNHYMKKSSRTARALASGKVYYFKQNDIVSRISW